MTTVFPCKYPISSSTNSNVEIPKFFNCPHSNLQAVWFVPWSFHFHPGCHERCRSKSGFCRWPWKNEIKNYRQITAFNFVKLINCTIDFKTSFAHNFLLYFSKISSNDHIFMYYTFSPSKSWSSLNLSKSSLKVPKSLPREVSSSSIFWALVM